IALASLKTIYSADGLYVMDSRGRHLRAVTPPHGDECEEWSPSGRKVLYCSHAGKLSFQVWVVNANGSGRSRLTRPVGLNDGATWSPSGTRIAFVSNRDGTG